VLFKSFFLRSLLGWVLVNVPNFVSTNLVDLISFLHFFFFFKKHLNLHYQSKKLITNIRI